MSASDRGPANGRGPRLGLCCAFVAAPIRFRITTASSLLRRPADERLEKLSQLVRANAEALFAAVAYCADHGIGAFRVPSTILPLRTHPDAGYEIDDLPGAGSIVDAFRRAGALGQERGIRLTFHPDQFVVLNSIREDVVDRAIDDLESHAEIADWIGADAINIHAGGAEGGKPRALDRLARNLDRLSDAARSRLTLENDDVVYSPRDLLPFCDRVRVPLVYDVHHHRCLPDGMTVEEATSAALDTWDREPLTHISSPLQGWTGAQPRRHHDWIDPADFPNAWRPLSITVDVEAKAKERAVLKLMTDLKPRRAVFPLHAESP